MIGTFFLGTHIMRWLDDVRFTTVPLFISRRQLAKRKTLHRAVGAWALDSGGYTELNKYGQWSITPAQYITEVRRYRADIGNLYWAAAQDWMCEPHVRAKTGLTVQDHQERTIDNYVELCTLDDSIAWTPVIQGWERADYLRHVDMYAARDIRLVDLQVVGVGSVCRRQGTDEIASILGELAGLGINLHGFGVKLQGLRKGAQHLVSADSMAWSRGAFRGQVLLPECVGLGHKNCANCARYALQWYDKVIKQIGLS